MQVTRASGAAAALALFVAGSARADDSASAFLSVYNDDDRLSVVSPQVVFRKDFGAATEVELGWEADIISAASVDVITSASPRGFEETRHGLSAGVTWSPAQGVAFGAKYLRSWESDYDSNGLAARAAYEWIERRLEQRLEFRVNFDRAGRAGEPERRWNDVALYSLSPSLGWVFDRRTTGSLVWEIQGVYGFQQSPYRFVPIAWSGPGGVAVPERHPRWRVRHALRASAKRALGRSWFVSVGYRAYRDNWAVTSHTADGGVEKAFLGDALIVGADVRAYWQGSASFYRERYEVSPGTLPVLRSRDKMLGRSRSVLAGLRCEYGFALPDVIDELRTTLRLDFYDQRFAEFEPLDGRRATVLQVGVRASIR